MGDFFNIALNGAISVLLVITIVYAVVLNRKLRQLQSNQSELAAILGRLDGALLTASVTVSALRETTDAPAVPEAPAYVPAPAPVPTQIVARPAPQAAPAVQRPAPAAQRPIAPQAAPAAAPALPAPQQPATPAAAAAPAPVPAPAKPAPKKAKAVLRADTLAERLEMNQVRPADGQPLMVQASAARPAQRGVRHRAAADELMSVMRNLRKG